MGLRFDPVGGGKFQAAIQATIEAERQPIQLLQQQKSVVESKLKLFGTFKNKFNDFDKTLSEFANFHSFRELKADLGDGKNIVGVTLDKDTALPGTYQMEIEQLAQRSSIISNGFPDPKKKDLGVGYVIGRDTKGKTFEMYVDQDHASLQGVSNLINDRDDLPFQATVIRDGTDPKNAWKLILNAKKDGREDAVDFPDFYFLDGSKDFYVDDRNDAQNAVVKIDGFKIQAKSNQISDFIQGVNLQLKQAKPGHPFTLTITEDHDKIAGKVKGLVDQVNSILDFINKQNQVDDKSDTRATFAGDASMQSVEYRLRNLIHEGFPVGKKGTKGFHYMFLNQIGVEFDKNGHLQFHDDKFKKAVESDYNTISMGIAGPHGFANQLRSVISQYTQMGSGFLALRQKSLQDRIREYDDQIDQKERNLDQKQKDLTARYARLESTLANMQQQQQYMQSTMGAGGGNNLVSQLLGGG